MGAITYALYMDHHPQCSYYSKLYTSDRSKMKKIIKYSRVIRKKNPIYLCLL